MPRAPRARSTLSRVLDDLRLHVVIAFVPLSPEYDRAAFTCGNDTLDTWLRVHARQQERTGNTRTTLGVDPETSRIVSYFALASHRLDLEDLRETALGTGRRYGMPTMLLARLAVHSRDQGTGLGTATLVEALRRLSRASRDVGFEAVVVDAIDRTAAEFYLRHGFSALTSDLRRLFLTTRDLQATFAETSGDGPR
jgi:GNAT superfamily N-acetyltransferase